MGFTALSLVGVREDSPWILCQGECILSHYEASFIRLNTCIVALDANGTGMLLT